MPDWESLEFAIQLANGGSLAVVEGFGTKLEGWARWHRAVDLTSNQLSETLPDDVLELVETLQCYGNNGFARGFGRDQALRRTTSMQLIDKDLTLGALLAAGQSASGVRRLSQLIG